MPTTSYGPTADPATKVSSALDRLARTDGRPVATVAQELSYRALFDSYLATSGGAGAQAQLRDRERFEVLLRQTKNALRNLDGRGADAPSSPDREVARPRA